MKMAKPKQSSTVGILSSVFAIVVGLLFGFLILLFSNPAQATGGMYAILMGATFRGMQSLGQVLYFATPIILTGLSVGFAFKTGLFNIGASGQFIVGSYLAIVVGVHGASLGGLQWVVGLIVAIIGGAIWGLIPGLLKALANVNEVISSIMMNYIGMYFVNFLVVRTVFDSLRNQSQRVDASAVIPTMGLNHIFPRSNVNGGFIIAVLVVIGIHLLLNKTTFGYELKAVGFNRDASKYAGINEKRNIILSMVIAGALAGLAGGLLHLAGSGKHIKVVEVLAAEGFQGIPVALLGLSNPIGILFAALFIAYISVGGNFMQLYDFVPEIIEIIIASIIYFSAFALIIKTFLQKRQNKAKPVIEGKAEGGSA